MLTTTARGTDLAHLVDILTEQNQRKIDVVAPAAALRFTGGSLDIDLDPVTELTDAGVTRIERSGHYLPSRLAVGDLAARLNIDVRYLRRLHETRRDLFDANVNGMLRGTAWQRDVIERYTWAALDDANDWNGADADPRRFLLRMFRTDEHGGGILRAVLSDSYAPMDNLQVLLPVLAAIQEAGIPADASLHGCDLSESNMVVRISVPSIRAYAPGLLAGYRSPFADPGVTRIGTGSWTPSRTTDDKPGAPVVFAGLRITNSEVGEGRFSITPAIVVQICSNGMTLTRDAVSKVHLGGRLPEGPIRWSEDTQSKEIEAVKARTRDAVRTFLDPAFITERVAALEAKAGHRVARPSTAIEEIGRNKALGYTDAECALILDHFMRGGQFTAGGIMQAVTSAAQAVADPDQALRLEDSAMTALDLAAGLR